MKEKSPRDRAITQCVKFLGSRGLETLTPDVNPVSAIVTGRGLP